MRMAFRAAISGLFAVALKLGWHFVNEEDHVHRQSLSETVSALHSVFPGSSG